MAKIKRGSGGKVGLGRNMPWSERPGSTKTKLSRGRYSRNSSEATAKATRSALGLTKEQYRKKAEEAKKQAKQKRARIRDIGQAVPEGYLRRQGSLYFALKENYRPDKKRNSKAKQDFALKNMDRFMRDGGWLDSTSKQGMLLADGTQNLRKTTAARNMMKKLGLYGRAGAKTRGKSAGIIYWGQDGKAP